MVDGGCQMILLPIEAELQELREENVLNQDGSAWKHFRNFFHFKLSSQACYSTALWVKLFTKVVISWFLLIYLSILYQKK